MVAFAVYKNEYKSHAGDIFTLGPDGYSGTNTFFHYLSTVEATMKATGKINR